MFDVRFSRPPRTLSMMFIIVLLCTSMVCFAQNVTIQAAEQTEPKEYRYDLGNQMYRVNIGPLFPLFIWTPSETPQVTAGTMRIGGYGSIVWDAFLDHQNSIGIELGYAFSDSLDDRMYSTIPILFRMTHFFSQGQIDFPVSIGIGAAYSSFDDQYYIGPALKPDLGVFWNANESWGFGLNVQYLFIPELYIGDFADQTSFGNFLGVNLSIKYNN